MTNEELHTAVNHLISNGLPGPYHLLIHPAQRDTAIAAAAAWTGQPITIHVHTSPTVKRTDWWLSPGPLDHATVNAALQDKTP